VTAGPPAMLTRDCTNVSVSAGAIDAGLPSGRHPQAASVVAAVAVVAVAAVGGKGFQRIGRGYTVGEGFAVGLVVGGGKGRPAAGTGGNGGLEAHQVVDLFVIHEIKVRYKRN
jgi:hypothetical protein